MSNADTIAPRRRVVAIACSPATPAPSTNARAGAIVPAAVVSIGRNFTSSAAPMSAALYPATVLCDESTSIDCAFVMRGTFSSESALMERFCSAAANSPALAGCMRATSRLPSLSRGTCSIDGRCTPSTRSASAALAASGTMVAPASTYLASGNPAAVPAALSTRISCPAFARRAILSGISATRRSPAVRSRRTPMRISSVSRRVPRARWFEPSHLRIVKVVATVHRHRAAHKVGRAAIATRRHPRHHAQVAGASSRAALSPRHAATDLLHATTEQLFAVSPLRHRS